ncbi:dTMP kinase [Nocardiopsis mwathae]|uniref:Thymidylate kinase n=1 Tax=Nocardiopsis mwathae TaxID=1472723 RepID=A0A7X0D7T8_9ACTN|nr:dTMP kinase [Nocardiopsis mwathae]MBB6174977.1 dTMP kinase [Nocardiopsis mwathae]
MSRSAPPGAPDEAHGVPDVLSITPFRRLWVSLSLSGLGDWLGLLALMSLAAILTRDSGPFAQYAAVSGVAALRLAPPILLSPFAGVLVDRADRRLTMVVGDALRALLLVSVPIVGRVDWLLAAAFATAIAALLWTPAKDALAADMVPTAKLRQADRVGRITLYGTAPVAAALFALLAAVSAVLAGLFPVLGAPAADIALYAAGAAYLAAAVVDWGLPGAKPGVSAHGSGGPVLPGAPAQPPSAPAAAPQAPRTPQPPRTPPTAAVEIPGGEEKTEQIAPLSTDDERTEEITPLGAGEETTEQIPHVGAGERATEQVPQVGAGEETTERIPHTGAGEEATERIPAAGAAAAGGQALPPQAPPPQAPTPAAGPQPGRPGGPGPSGPARSPQAPPRSAAAPGRAPENLLRTFADGVRFAGTTPLVRGLLLGMLGVFAASAAVLGVGRIFTDRLSAGNAGFALLFAAVTAGIALGVYVGPRVLRAFSRRRLFGLSVGLAGAALVLTGLVPNMVLAAVLSTVVGTGVGIAWVIGTSLLGQEIEGEVRERTLAYLRTAAHVLLAIVLVVAPLVAGLIGDHRLDVRDLGYDVLGTGMVLVLAGLAVLLVAVVSYRQIDEGAEVPLLTELIAVLRGVPVGPVKAEEKLPGTFIVLEGGEGAGKSTQARQLSIWLRDEGFEVVTTREPGSTKLGMRLRALLLDKEQTGMSPRAEALLYAADRADHVSRVIRPALRRGAIVISDRYVDSTLAYQGAGRELHVGEIRRINEWATDELVPDLTVLLDVPPSAGLARLGGTTDRIEAESEDFHDRVRSGFRELAESEPERYLVVDGRSPQEEVTRQIQRRIRPILPDPVPQDAEAITGMMPIIKEQ